MLLVDGAFWCPETLNDLLGVTARHVVARGHASYFVYDSVTGALLARVPAPQRRMRDVVGIASPSPTEVVIQRATEPSIAIAFAAHAPVATRELPPCPPAPPPRAPREAHSRDGTWRVHATDTRVVVERAGQVVQTFPGHWSHSQLAVADDGSLVAFGGERIRVGVVATGEVRNASDPPGHLAGLAVRGAVRIRVDAIAGAQLFAPGGVRWIPEVDGFPHVAPDGATLVATGVRSLGRWDLATGAPRERVDLAGKVAQIAWSGDTRRAAVATYDTTGLLLIVHGAITIYEDCRAIATLVPPGAAPEPQAPPFALAPAGDALVVLDEHDDGTASLVTHAIAGDRLVERARAPAPRGTTDLFYTPAGALALATETGLRVGDATLALHHGFASAWSRTHLAHASPAGIVVRDARTLAEVARLPIADVIGLALDDTAPAVLWADRAGRTGVATFPA